MLQLLLLEMRTAEGPPEAGVAIGLSLQPLRPEWCMDTIVVDASEDEVYNWCMANLRISNDVERKKCGRTHQRETDKEREGERRGRYSDDGE